MKNVAIICKTYHKDQDRFKVLYESIQKYNKDNIPFYAIDKLDRFYELQSQVGLKTYEFLSDEAISNELNIPSGYSNGWINQQLFKSFPHLVLKDLEYFIMIDSDSIFIRDFYLKDFFIMDGNKIEHPYTICHEQKDLFSWFSINKNLFSFNAKKSFEESRQPIKNIFDNKSLSYDFGPIPIICSTKVWKFLLNEYCKDANISVYNLFYKHASEFTWYGEAFLASGIHPLYPREPLFKVFHYLQQYVEYKQKGITLNQIADNYLGVVMQSSSGLPKEY